MITLRPLTEQDARLIQRWPPYPAESSDLDYALREDGWVAEFAVVPQTYFHLAEDGKEPVGFALLSKTGADEAEFRIALHADKQGQGYGAAITRAVLEKGFSEMGLSRIHLIVRKNNPRALRLYAKLGFVPRGECVLPIHGKRVAFIEMDIRRDAVEAG